MSELTTKLHWQCHSMVRRQQLVDSDYLEKFAELLVLECANYIDAFNRENMVEEGIGGAELKKHFGVKDV